MDPTVTHEQHDERKALKAMAELIQVKVKREAPTHLERYHFGPRLQSLKTGRESTNEGGKVFA